MLSLLFACVVAAAVPDADTAALTAMVADVAGRANGVSVVTRKDLVQLMEMGAAQQSMGCDTASASCLAEVAQALGAEIIVRGELGSIDNEPSLSLSVLNSADLTATARAVVRGRSIGELGNEVARVLPGLVMKVRPKNQANTRLFVTDVERVGGTAVDVVAPVSAAGGGGPSWALVTGGIVGGVGVLGLGVAVVSELQVQALQQQIQAGGDDVLSVKAAVRANDDRETWARVGQVTWLVGGGLVVVGGALLVMGVME